MIIECYHGLDNKFKVFNKKFLGYNTNIKNTNCFFFTDNKDVAKSYGLYVTKWILKPENEIVVNFNNTSHCYLFDKEYTPSELARLIDTINNNGLYIFDIPYTYDEYIELSDDEEDVASYEEYIEEPWLRTTDYVEDYVANELELLGYDRYYNDGIIDCIVMKNVNDAFDMFDNTISTNYTVFDTNIIHRG